MKITIISLLTGALLSGCAIRDDALRSPIDIPGPGVVAYAAGDIADCRRHLPQNTGAARTAELIEEDAAGRTDFAVLALGDSTYPVGLPKEFEDCYAPTWGRFKERTYPAPGNHEYYTAGAPGYYGYFGAAAGPGKRGYYSFRFGTWHVISLNSNLKGAEFSEQLDWLKNDLAQNRGSCILAYWHHPVFSSGGHASNEGMMPVWKALAAAGADIVLAAHDHNYERFAPQNADGQRDELRGMRQFVVGTGGARLTPMRFAKANSETGNNATNGVLKLTLKPSGYEWEFLATRPDEYSDRGAAFCH